MCRVCKDVAHPRQPHAADCRLHGLLAEFAGRTRNHFANTVKEQESGDGRAGDHGGGGGGEGGEEGDSGGGRVGATGESGGGNSLAR